MCLFKNPIFICIFIYLFIISSACTKEAYLHKAKEKDYIRKRMEMIKTQLIPRGIKDKAVLEAMSKVERHKFVPEDLRAAAYGDHPLPIGYSQTISQPYIVAYMSEISLIKKSDKILEIGTGSGYQAAILAELANKVYTIEIVEALGKNSKTLLKNLKYKNVKVKIGDGYQGWQEHAPFDVIILTAAPNHVPTPLLKQLKIGGRLIMPVGDYVQDLIRITRTKDTYKKEKLIGVRFVPMTGEAEKK